MCQYYFIDKIISYVIPKEVFVCWWTMEVTWLSWFMWLFKHRVSRLQRGNSKFEPNLFPSLLHIQDQASFVLLYNRFGNKNNLKTLSCSPYKRHHYSTVWCKYLWHNINTQTLNIQQQDNIHIKHTWQCVADQQRQSKI